MSNDAVLDDIARAKLLSYLAGELGGEVAFDVQPLALARGTGSHVYRFRLTGAPDGPWSGPLVLRLIVLHLGKEWVERESAIHSFVVERGYPAPRLLAVESSGEVIGSPFTIMEQALGETVERRLRGRNLITAYRLGTVFADTHVALHRLPVEGYPLRVEGSSVDRRLAPFREGRLGQGDEMQEALAWLKARKRAVIPEELSVCHNNFHPANVIVDRRLRAQVIDWATADLGDRHGDVAEALISLRTQQLRAENPLGVIFGRLMRAVFLRRYLGRYDAQLPLDRGRLRYWEALSAFVRQGVLDALQPGAIARQEYSTEAAKKRRARLAQYFEERRREIEA